MNVEVIDGLAAVGTGVDHRTVAFCESFGPGDFCGNGKEMANESAVLAAGLGNRRDVGAGNDEDVHRGLRMDVREDVTLVVLINGLRGNASVEDAAKKAAHGSLRESLSSDRAADQRKTRLGASILTIRIWR